MPLDGFAITDDDILIRRIPPSKESFQTVVQGANGRQRAVSSVMTVRDQESDLSCSLLRITSPQLLLDHLRAQQKDPAGWLVCAFRVCDLKAIGFTVEPSPIPDGDLGHCSVRNPESNGGPTFPSAMAKKLSKITVVLNDDEVQDPVRIQQLFS